MATHEERFNELDTEVGVLDEKYFTDIQNSEDVEELVAYRKELYGKIIEAFQLIDDYVNDLDLDDVEVVFQLEALDKRYEGMYNLMYILENRLMDEFDYTYKDLEDDNIEYDKELFNIPEEELVDELQQLYKITGYELQSSRSSLRELFGGYIEDGMFAALMEQLEKLRSVSKDESEYVLEIKYRETADRGRIINSYYLVDHKI